MKKLSNNKGFGLIELTMIIIIVGILTAVAMQSMTTMVQDARQIKTEREMEMLADAIVGNSELTSNGTRSDFGYVGDIGAFPPNLQALYQNPGSYTTWNGPYIETGFSQDTDGFKKDEWGTDYTYAGGITITSTGSGSTITKKIADATSDYLLNTFNGTITDANDSLPGTTYDDSVDIKITIPDGSGNTVTKTYHPDSTGAFTLDSLPSGQHAVNIIYTPEVDTLHRYLTILPRHKSNRSFKFASAHFGGGSSCAGSGTVTLRPGGTGTLTGLATDGCASNWQCVDEATADDDATRIVRATNSYTTDTYQMENPSDTTCTITSVTVYCRARKAHTQGNVKPTLYVGSTEYNGTAQALTSSYADYNQQWTTNPNTSSAWTWTEIITLEAGIALKGQNSSFPAYCTQVWVEVSYGP